MLLADKVKQLSEEKELAGEALKVALEKIKKWYDRIGKYQ